MLNVLNHYEYLYITLVKYAEKFVIL